MRRLFKAVQSIIESGEYADEELLRLTLVKQDAALVACEIEAGERLVTFLHKVSDDSSSFGKDIIGNAALRLVIERAKLHQIAATKRLEKVLAEFSENAADFVAARRGVVVAQQLKALRRRLAELDRSLRAASKSIGAA